MYYESDFDYEANFDDEELAELFAAGSAPEEMQALFMQMEMADRMRNRKGAEGRDAGRAYVAANPLEHIADAMHRIKGNKDFRDASEQLPEISRRFADARKIYWQGGRSGQAARAARRGMVDPGADQGLVPEPQIAQQQAMASAIRGGGRAAPPAAEYPENDFASAVSAANPASMGAGADLSASMGQPLVMSPEAFGAGMNYDLGAGPQHKGSLQKYMNPEAYQRQQAAKIRERKRLGMLNGSL